MEDGLSVVLVDEKSRLECGKVLLRELEVSVLSWSLLYKWVETSEINLY